MKQAPVGAVFVSIVMFGLYVPMGYYTDRFLYERRQRKDAEAAAAAAAAPVEGKTNGKAK
jgi:hypothetical protein